MEQPDSAAAVEQALLALMTRYKRVGFVGEKLIIEAINVLFRHMLDQDVRIAMMEAGQPDETK
jgi:hypothetical protein